ncbi:MAG: hypothetical protein Q7J78_06100 [Clostridiales bacterium]|nr:hypothetical protein [Clostridiales bacterium]
MFGKSKNKELNKYVIAVKDLELTNEALKNETITLPYQKSIYRDLIATAGKKVSNLKELKKFIKIQKKTKAEVIHYWEGMIKEGFTLMDVVYESKTPSIERLCDNPKIKYICKV